MRIILTPKDNRPAITLAISIFPPDAVQIILPLAKKYAGMASMVSLYRVEVKEI